MTAAALAPQEHRLRPTAGLRGTPAVALSAWKGRSGRRYVVGVHELRDDRLGEAGACVALGVARDKDGFATTKRIAVFETSASLAQRAAWIDGAMQAGCSELHIHRLCDSVAERAATAEDLRP